MQKILAPRITAKELWSKTPDEFNVWRKIHDYPRIIEYCKNNLTNFIQWMKEQKVTDNDFLEFDIGVFIKPEAIIMIYELEDKEKKIIYEIREPKNLVGDIIFHEKTVLSRRDIIPYFTWARKNKECINNRIEILFTVNYKSGRKTYIHNNLELVDAGNSILPRNYLLSGRNLDFLNLDDLTINYGTNNSNLNIWYSSAINLTINGDLAFVNIYKTALTQVGSVRINALKLNNGRFQDWRIKSSETFLIAKNSELLNWLVKESSFNATLDNSDIQECEFKESEINFKRDYYKAAQLHKNIKILYSYIGQKSNAGKHFYKEKVFEQKALLYSPMTCLGYNPFKNETKKYQKKFRIVLHYLQSYTKSISLFFQKYLWGFGEKPSRVFLWSIFVIMLSAFIYYFNSDSSTVGSDINSTYYSIVTFTTLGYGDVLQTDSFLKIWSAIEALLGLLFMGLVIAGFAAKSKEY